MMKQVVNVAASVRQRLLNLACERKEDFGLLLTKYGLERVLYCAFIDIRFLAALRRMKPIGLTSFCGARFTPKLSID